jgi:competence protein ComEA
MGRREDAQNTDLARSRVAALRRAPVPDDAWPADEREPEPERDWQRFLPGALRNAAISPGSRGLRVLAAVAVLVAVVAGVAAWRSRPAADPVVQSVALPSAPTSSAAQTVVAVSGKVRRPGLVRLPAGARVADALQAAGGALPGAELGGLNLARKVVDGELIAVGVPGQQAAPSDAAASGQPLDLNTASTEQLEALPGVGPVLAQSIVTYRTGHGGFRSVDELREVDGIGDSRYERLKDLVRV